MPPLSSLHRRLAAVTLLGLVALSAPAQGEDGSEWDRARARLAATAPSGMAAAVARWKQLTASDSAGSFDDYAGFLVAYPGFPEEWKLRTAAEKKVDAAAGDPNRLVALFDRFPPLTNPARAAYALALAAVHRPEAADMARAAWRGGPMSEANEAAILARWGGTFSAEDQEARADALAWEGAADGASRQLDRLGPAARPLALARLSLLRGIDPEAPAPAPAEGTAPLATPALPAGALRDPGYLYNRAKFLLRQRGSQAAAQLLASRPLLARAPLDTRKWVSLQLVAARDADARSAVAIAEKIDDAFPPRTELPRLIFPIRDDYTSLMWLGGTLALYQLNDPARAAPLFYRYGNAARTPQTRAKGFYWAGRALARAGQGEAAARYFDYAAQYPDQFYGQLALERLGRPLPDLNDPAHAAASTSARAAFLDRPIARAVRELAREGDWQTTIRFFKAIADQGRNEEDFVILLDFARDLGRRDLAVIGAQAASNAGLPGFRAAAFPLIPVPQGTQDWTMVHAISRQESQFAANAVSHSGARGLMQLMPGYAAAEARKSGIAYSFNGLTDDPALNIRIGDAMFARLMTIYNGSYPLAIAAYNAGPGNVNKWLRAYGDPRTGNIDWLDWIERLPFYETRGYITRVIENAVVYEALNPDRASYKGPQPVAHFLGKKAG
ncbi:MAG: lytic transglycosylase domain-containing protein [Proteobacteria bacterium]|nr:lytic transglycosylase domain-containing protein [Pseudomonadota bacterium]